MGNTISKSNPGSYRYVCPVINCFFTHLESTCNFPYRLSSVVSMCFCASDLLCWNADRFPKGVCYPAQRSDRQLLGGVWAQVRTMRRWFIATSAVTQWSFKLNYVMSNLERLCVKHSVCRSVQISLSVLQQRLLNPFECPYNGSRRQDCDCRNDYSAAGYTLFHKVRLDLSSLRIMSA